MAGAKAAVVASVAAAIPTVSILIFDAILHVLMDDFDYNFSSNGNCSWPALGCCHGRGPTSILLLKPSSSPQVTDTLLVLPFTKTFSDAAYVYIDVTNGEFGLLQSQEQPTS